ncbi:MAG: hypothetical protein AB7W59_20640 [Acidimicrobiia bacterium]
MDGREAERAQMLVELLRLEVERIERIIDLLGSVDAFNVDLALAADETHWRRRAVELRARLSVLP